MLSFNNRKNIYMHTISTLSLYKFVFFKLHSGVEVAWNWRITNSDSFQESSPATWNLRKKYRNHKVISKKTDTYINVLASSAGKIGGIHVESAWG